ncbi:MAG: sulfatase [bacterium]|nr:sulfatase [bacterium]
MSVGESPLQDPPSDHPTGLATDQPGVSAAASWKEFLPLGLWTMGALATLRSAALLGIAQARSAGTQSAEFVRWEILGRLHERLIEPGIVGVLGAVLAFHAARSPRSKASLLLALTAIFFGSYLTGWPAAPEIERLQFGPEFSLGNASLQSLLAGVIAVALFLVAAAVWRGKLRLFSGTLAVVVAGLLAVVLPTYLGLRGGGAPEFPLRVVRLDLVAQRGSWRAVEQNEGAPAKAGVLTPAVSAHTDSADKPALVMPPPCDVEFVVPEDEEGDALRFRCAAGIDQRVTNRLGSHGLESVTVEYAIAVNGEERWREPITAEAPKPGGWDPSRWIWHHAGGEGGVEVAPGDVVRMSTRLVDGEGLADVPKEFWRVGFGGCVVDNTVHRPRTRATPDAPNIVLIVMDTQRADRMSCHGYGKLTTPNLDRLARRGMQFDAAYSTSSWTWPATASILTGLPPEAHGVVSNAACTLNFEQLSLPEVLQWRGYTTAAFSCNPLIVPERYFDQGFESFDYHPSEFRMSDEVVPAVLDWLNAHAKARFFLYLHLADPHTPHRPDEQLFSRLGGGEQPQEWPEKGLDFLPENPRLPGAGLPDDVVRYANELYDASVATGDMWVGEVLKRLQALGIDDRTIIAFTADHGEELLERGRKGHGHGVHHELVHVPLLLAGPGIPRGVRCSSIVSNRHVAPTLARIGGAEIEGMGDAQFLFEYTGGLSDVPGSAYYQTVKGKWGERSRLTLHGLRADTSVLHWSEETGEARAFDVVLDPDERDPTSAVGDRDALLTDLAKRLGEQRAFAPEYTVFGVGPSGRKVLEGINYAGGDDDDEDED